MKAEALRELISGKHPLTDALQLSNPGLLKHSAQSGEERARSRQGEHRGWAGPGRCNYLRQERAGLRSVPEHTLSCASSRLQSRRAACPSPPQGRGSSRPSAQKHFSSRTAPKGNRNSGAAISARG